jgi:hypothetical protein
MELDAIARDAVAAYEQETSTLFDARFGVQVRRIHDLMALRGLRDRDLDAFYLRPTNAFEINVVAEKLAALARGLERS